MLRPIVRPVTQPIAFSLNGRKPFHVPTYLLGRVIDIIGDNEGAVFDVAAAFARNAIWEDSARTTPASVDGPVGSIQDELLRYYAEQATSGARPILRMDGAGKYWLESDGTKWLSFSVPAPLDGTFLAAACRPDGGTTFGDIVGCFNNNDTNGGMCLTWDNNSGSGQIRSLYRTAGASTSVGTGPNGAPAGNDWVADSVYASSAADLLVNGVSYGSTTGTKIGASKTYTLMARTAGGTALTGRLYAALVGAVNPNASQRDAVRQWAAQRAGVVLP